jgi:hypothetical protein
MSIARKIGAKYNVGVKQILVKSLKQKNNEDSVKCNLYCLNMQI